jgi:hypothetical protein
MTISIFRWTDGPYLAFEDHERQRRYVLDSCRAQSLLDRLGAHVGSGLDRTLVIDLGIVRDPVRDLTVTDIYVQDCDNLFEVITATGPILLVSPIEAGTLLLLAVDMPVGAGLQPVRTMPGHVDGALPPAAPADAVAARTSLALPIWTVAPALMTLPGEAATLG